MINFLLSILGMILILIPFFLLCKINVKANLPKADRSRQCFMPFVALILVVVIMVAEGWINQWLINLLNQIPVWIYELGNRIPAISGVCNNIAASIMNFLRAIDLQLWIAVVFNTAILLVYILLKRSCVSIMKKLLKPGSMITTKLSGICYEYQVETGTWCVKENYKQTRKMFKVLYWSVVILSSILMIATRFFYSAGILTKLFYPVYGVILIGELYFYLDGYTKGEYDDRFSAEDENARSITNYTLLRKYLRSLFSDKLMEENTSINSPVENKVTNDEVLQSLSLHEDTMISSYGAYLKKLNKQGFNFDHNYIYSGLELLKGKSVLFNNPFYHDLIPYIFYPMNRKLLAHKKVLVILGRHGIEEDITSWIEKGIGEVTNIPYLWNVEVLSKEPKQNADIGILTQSAVLDMSVHEANAQFFEDVEYVVVVEPSRLIATAQIGLNLVVKKCKNRNEDKEIVYCLIDKNSDGLVDAMSHVLMTDLVEVSATKKHEGTVSYMCWDADDEYLHHRIVPNISRYLGLGTELSFAALKNQVSKTRWYGGEAFPVTDMNWVAKQYYFDLLKYAQLPASQETMNACFETSANFWSAAIEKKSYISVEDESFNMFEILRDFATRSTEQGFINVMASSYLLKDYMADNSSIFEADAKAIPSIVADYARTPRNTTLRLLLMMSTFPVDEDVLVRELSLLGIQATQIRKQLWLEIYKCFENTEAIYKLPKDYMEAVEKAAGLTLSTEKENISIDILKVKEEYDYREEKLKQIYYIDNKNFIDTFVSGLKSAGYIAEDEKNGKSYMGTELIDQIYQKHLPGQFFTQNGKYYEMQYLTADGNIMMRRAADHITGRPSYRQIRNYKISGIKESEQIGAKKNISGIVLSKGYADFSVETPGYFRMLKHNDFSSAKKVLLEGEQTGIPTREYKNKEFLKIVLPNVNGQMTDKIRYTITVLINEVFRTLFAENQAYISAVTESSFTKEDESLVPFTYTVEGTGATLDSNAIYFIEDSQLDLGLIEAVERNIKRILEIICDYLAWHDEQIQISLQPAVQKKKPSDFDTFKEPEPETLGQRMRRTRLGSIIGRIVDKIKSLFNRKAKPVTADAEKSEPIKENLQDDSFEVGTELSEVGDEHPEVEGENSEQLQVQEEDAAEEELLEEAETFEEAEAEEETETFEDVEAEEAEAAEEETETLEEAEPEEEAETLEEAEPEAEAAAESEAAEEDSDEPKILLSTIGGNRGVSDDICFEEEDVVGIPMREPYHRRHYMLYGLDEVPSVLDLENTHAYLEAMGFGTNPLKKARDGKKLAEFTESMFSPGKAGARYCDYCGSEIYGCEYETLADGTDRCMNCSRTAVKTKEEFVALFETVKQNMETLYGINLNIGIKVEVVSSKTLHRRLRKRFVPTSNMDARVVGVAIKNKDSFNLLIENGAPRMSSALTMAHELTHIWQYVNWDAKKIRKTYGASLELEIYEGMAKWAEVQYAYLINERARAKREEIITMQREDEYGNGFLRYTANYPLTEDTILSGETPFMHPDLPLKFEYCGGVRRKEIMSEDEI